MVHLLTTLDTANLAHLRGVQLMVVNNFIVGVNPVTHCECSLTTILSSVTIANVLPSVSHHRSSVVHCYSRIDISSRLDSICVRVYLRGATGAILHFLLIRDVLLQVYSFP